MEDFSNAMKQRFDKAFKKLSDTFDSVNEKIYREQILLSDRLIILKEYDLKVKHGLLGLIKDGPFQFEMKDVERQIEDQHTSLDEITCEIESLVAKIVVPLEDYESPLFPKKKCSLKDEKLIDEIVECNVKLTVEATVESSESRCRYDEVVGNISDSIVALYNKDENFTDLFIINSESQNVFKPLKRFWNKKVNYLVCQKKLLIIDNEVFQISIDQLLDKIGDIKS